MWLETEIGYHTVCIKGGASCGLPGQMLVITAELKKKHEISFSLVPCCGSAAFTSTFLPFKYQAAVISVLQAAPITLNTVWVAKDGHPGSTTYT